MLCRITKMADEFAKHRLCLQIVSLCLVFALSSALTDEIGNFAESISSMFSLDDDNCEFLCPDGQEHVRNVNHVPSSNGCGSFGIQVKSDDVPGMTQCCNKHDICYDTCGTDRITCDGTFKVCLNRICTNMKNTAKSAKKITDCKTTVMLVHAGSQAFGCTAFIDAQKKACICRKISGKWRKEKMAVKQKKADLHMPDLKDLWPHDEI